MTKQLKDTSTNPTTPEVQQDTSTAGEETNELRKFTVELFNDFRSYKEGTEKSLKDLEKKVAGVDKKVENKIGKFDDKIEEKQSKTTEVLAIFITLFTFISININIFTRLTDVRTAIWFVVITTVCSIILVSFLLIAIGYNPIKTKRSWIGLFIALAILIGLVALTYFWNPSINPIPDKAALKQTSPLV